MESYNGCAISVKGKGNERKMKKKSAARHDDMCSNCGTNFFLWITYNGTILHFKATTWRIYRQRLNARPTFFVSHEIEFCFVSQRDFVAQLQCDGWIIVLANIKNRILAKLECQHKIYIFCILRQLLSPKIQMTKKKTVKNWKLLVQFPIPCATSQIWSVQHLHAQSPPMYFLISEFEFFFLHKLLNCLCVGVCVCVYVEWALTFCATYCVRNRMLEYALAGKICESI